MRTLVLGIGNLLWADEGFGVRCVEAFNEAYTASGDVTVLDGGTQGLYLLPFLEEADALVVFDAVDYGLVPGEMKVVRDSDVPAFMGAKKMSLHQTGFQDVIATAQLMGYCPEHLLLIGVQPEELEDYGGGLRDVVAAQIPAALDIAIDELRALGHQVTERDAGDAVAKLSAAPILRDAYEGGRPSAEDACRVGDDRFLVR